MAFFDSLCEIGFEKLLALKFTRELSLLSKSQTTSIDFSNSFTDSDVFDGSKGLHGININTNTSRNA